MKQNMYIDRCVSVCQECAKIGNEIHSDKIATLAQNATLKNDGKLKIVFVGKQYRQLVAVAEEAIEGEVLNGENKTAEPLSNYLSAPIDVCLSYGRQESDASHSTDLPQCGLWLYPYESLQNIDVEIIASPNLYADFDWEEKLPYVDYLFLVTDATMALSSGERAFIEEYVTRYIGPQRFSIIIANTQVINSVEDYDALLNRINYFLQSVQGGHLFEAGTEALNLFINNLVSQKDSIALLAAHQAVACCLESTKKELSLMLAQTEDGAKKLENGIQVLQKRKSQMLRMGEIAASKANSEIAGKLRYNCNDLVNSFIVKLKEEVTETVLRTQDFDKTAALLPSFLASAGEECMNQLQDYIDAQTEQLQQGLKIQMLADAEEYFEDIPLDFDASDLDKDIAHQRSAFHLETESTTEKNVNTCSRVLILSAIPITILGFAPVAVGSIVGSQLLKYFSLEKIKAESQQSLSKQAGLACETLRSEIEHEVADKLNQLALQAENNVNHGYSKFVESIIDTLECKKETSLSVSAKREQIRPIIEERLPQLTSSIEVDSLGIQI